MLKFFPDPILKQKCSSVVFPLTQEYKNIISLMIDEMYVNNGVGLAAPQIGFLKKIIIVDPSSGEDSTALKILINPTIKKFSDKKISSHEGCLSIPDVFVVVSRSEEIWLEYYNQEGNLKRMEANGFAATIIQHEYEHLDGIVMLDHLGEMGKKYALKNYKIKI